MLRVREKITAAANNRAAMSGLIRIGVTELVAVTWLSDLIAVIKARYPLLAIEPVVDLIVELYGNLEDRSVDIVIGPRAYKDDQYEYRLLGKVEQAWLCSPTLFRSEGPVALQTLKSLPLLMQPKGSGLQFLINRLLEENQVRIKSAITCNGMMALAEMAAAGLGVACLPQFLFEKEIAEHRLCVVETIPALPPLQYATATRRDAVGSLGAEVSVLAAEVCSFTTKRRPSPVS